jgi:hypothetical protein
METKVPWMDFVYIQIGEEVTDATVLLEVVLLTNAMLLSKARDGN